MRIAENEYLALLIANLLQMTEIHLIISIFTHFQRIEHHFPAISLWGQTERMINRRLDYNLLVFLGEHIDDHADALDDSWNKTDPLPLDIPLMMVSHPIHDRWQKIFWLYRIAEERMLQTGFDGICDKGGCLKIHISHPERKKILSSPTWQQSLMLEVTTARAVYDLIKIVFHNFLFCTSYCLKVIKQNWTQCEVKN